MLLRLSSSLRQNATAAAAANMRPMLAAVLPGVKELMVPRDVLLRPPGPGEILVKNAATGVCHTDLSVIQGRLNFPTPCVVGHETAGEVVEFGPGVSESKGSDL